MEKWNDKHQEQAAEYCADNFPAKELPPDTITLNDSTSFNHYRDSINLVLDSLQNSGDTLIDDLGHDTACVKYQNRVRVLVAEIQRLRNRIINTPPIVIRETITKTIIDSAQAVATREKNKRLERELSDANVKIKSYQLEIKYLKGKSNDRLWMFIAAGLAVVLLIIMLFKKKTSGLGIWTLVTGLISRLKKSRS